MTGEAAGGGSEASGPPRLGVASLGMYDFPPLEAANDTLWSAIAARLSVAGLKRVAFTLDRARPLDAIWRDPRLLLAQTCGYPLVTSLAGVVVPVATPVYDLPGCDGPWYRSVIVVRADEPASDLGELRGRRLAVNARDSNSGMNLVRATVAPFAVSGRFFGAVRVTGSHLASLAAIASGEADVAGIDCVTFGLLRRHRPAALATLRVLGATAPSPGLPLVTAAARRAPERSALLDALLEVAGDPALAAARHALAITGFVPLTLADYEPVAALEREAIAARYDMLA